LQNTGGSDLDINSKVKIEPTDLDFGEEGIKEEVVDNVIELGAEAYISDEEAQPQNTRTASPSLFTITKSRDHMLTACDIYEDTDTR
jgi:hypothetical protein